MESVGQTLTSLVGLFVAVGLYLCVGEGGGACVSACVRVFVCVCMFARHITVGLLFVQHASVR